MPKILPTEQDRKNVRNWAWEHVKYLGLTRRDRVLLATKLELEWWDAFRRQQAQEDGLVR